MYTNMVTSVHNSGKYMLIFCNFGLNDASQDHLGVLSCVSKCYTPRKIAKLDVDPP